MGFSFRKQAVTALVGLGLILGLLAVAGWTNIFGASQASTTNGATYVEAVIGLPRFVNPLLATSDIDVDLAHLVFSGLTLVDAGGNIAPDMASEWQSSPDGLVYSFTLKPDLKWHDGKPVTSEDVAATLGLLKAPDFVGNTALTASWRDVAVAAPSPQTVRFTLAAPNAAFLQLTTLGMLPKHLWAAVKPGEVAASGLNGAPIGSGPWRYVRGQTPTSGGAVNAEGTPVPGGLPPEEGVLLEPNPDLPTPNPRIARLWFRPYPTFGAALSGFKLGEAHGLGHIPDERMAEVADVPGVTLHRRRLARYAMLIFNVRQPLLKQREVRQAMEFAINREALVAQALDGLGQPLISPILPGSWAYDASLKGRGYDPAEARRLLESAGWKLGANGVRVRDGITMTLSLAANRDVPANMAVARQVEGYLRAAGIDVQLALVGRDTLLKSYLEPRAFHLIIAGWEASGADPDLYAYWHSSQVNVAGGLNFSGWINPQADAALQAALLTPSRMQRRQEYAAFQKAFYEDAPSVVLYSPLYTYATRAPAQGVTLPPSDMLTPAARFDTMQWWTLDDRR